MYLVFLSVIRPWCLLGTKRREDCQTQTRDVELLLEEMWCCGWRWGRCGYHLERGSGFSGFVPGGMKQAPSKGVVGVRLDAVQAVQALY